uniref:Uncharacterized protein n=1 Tax=Grammatophora oceanica TaxID=210454 RepID=A0A7S1Y205_9STRA|mmetsp:Transcript_1266/g.1789  ORF Transcript_1266/g.1789 Transcript_1266/m.1789 type:complete len:146 (+) Transcript_1266:692-1129(+)
MKNMKRTGSIPEWIEEMTSLHLLDLDHNDLTGEIPSAITKLSGIKFLLLNRNPSLGGLLPSGLSDMKNLKLLLLDNTAITNHADDLCDVVADCSLDCPCCTSCCSVEDDDCNEDALIASYGPIYEGRRFFRDEYHFFEGSKPIQG